VTGWTDAHCHLQERYLGDDDQVRADVAATLARASAAGVDRVVVVGTDAVTSREALALAHDARGPVGVMATVGLHPHDATQGVDEVAALAREGSSKLVAIGECGLDYYYEHSPRDVQRQVFAQQIGLAHELDLALVIHARDAWDDLFEILSIEGVPARTVIHCFTGGPNEAETSLAMGCDLSISGVVTFKNSASLRDAIKITPLSRLHVETDSPFLAPIPHRGKKNEPAFVSVVGDYVASLLGVESEDLRNATATNSARLFRWSRDNAVDQTV
jgi:TatD DNase family protein